MPRPASACSRDSAPRRSTSTWARCSTRLNLRRYLPLLTGAGEDADNVNPFGVNRFSGANVSTIAIEVPITRVTSDGKPAATTRQSGHRHVCQHCAAEGCGALHDRTAISSATRARSIQVSRMGNPLVNELIINTPDKDDWNVAEPEDEAQFQEFYKNPVIATALELVYHVPVVAARRFAGATTAPT